MIDVLNEVAAHPDLVEAELDDAFWDIVCADEDLLHAEFDAIMAADFPDQRGGTVPPVRPQHGRPPPLPGAPHPARPGSWVHATFLPIARQRSPPELTVSIPEA